MNPETELLLQKAETVYRKNHPNTCRFERAIFLSWYCSLGDCTFCYMSTQRDKIQDPLKARRSPGSILAEVLLTKKLGWNIEFLSSGYGAYTTEEILRLVHSCSQVAEEKLWLNIGYLTEKQIDAFLPHIRGISVSIETVNWKLRKKVCPSKPLEPMLETLKLAKKNHLKKAITIIIGLGETLKDLGELFKFVEQYHLDRVTFYALNPHPGTPFQKGPETEYYLQWIAQTRIHFPKLEIIAGSWVNRLQEVHLLLRAGANAFTKFPALNLFGSSYARKLEQEVKKAGRVLEGSLTQWPKVDWEQEIRQLPLGEREQKEMYSKLKQYLKRGLATRK